MSTLPPILSELRQNLQQKPGKKTALAIIKAYMQFFDNDDVKEELLELSLSIVSTDSMQESQSAADRRNHIFFYGFTALFIDAIYTLQQNKKTKKKEKADYTDEFLKPAHN